MLQEIGVMALQTATCTEFRPLRDVARPLCSECGQMLLAPEASEFVDEGRIQHSWACDSCGNQFRTAIRVPSR
jgi:RNase P subunit RPR2